jgi:alpha-glucosidase
MVGEIGDDDGLACLAEYTRGGDKLHMAYCFDLLGTEHSSSFLHNFLSRFERISEGGWPCWALSNHDVPRYATRWGGAAPDAALLRLAAAMQTSLRGSSCIYQGDELGLPEVSIAFEDLQDPYGITMWPEFKGRDGCRTPMPWISKASDLGFSPVGKAAAKPWLPIAETHRTLAADAQEASPDSLLQFYRRLLQWRKTQPTILHGDMQLLPVDAQVFAFVRATDAQRVLCVFNFSNRPASYALPADCHAATVLTESGLTGATLKGGSVDLAPWGGLFAQLN